MGSPRHIYSTISFPSSLVACFVAGEPGRAATFAYMYTMGARSLPWQHHQRDTHCMRNTLMCRLGDELCFANCGNNSPRIAAHGNTQQGMTTVTKCQDIIIFILNTSERVTFCLEYFKSVLSFKLLPWSSSWLRFNDTRLAYLVHRPFRSWVWSATYLSEWLTVV